MFDLLFWADLDLQGTKLRLKSDSFLLLGWSTTVHVRTTKTQYVLQSVCINTPTRRLYCISDQPHLKETFNKVVKIVLPTTASGSYRTYYYICIMCWFPCVLYHLTEVACCLLQSSALHRQEVTRGSGFRDWSAPVWCMAELTRFVKSRLFWLWRATVMFVGFTQIS